MLAQPEPWSFGAEHKDGGGDPATSEERPRAHRWTCADSDALSLLGAYHAWRSAGGGERGALSTGLIPKVMKEASLKLDTHLFSRPEHQHHVLAVQLGR